MDNQESACIKVTASHHKRRLIVVILVSTIFCVDQMLCTVIIPILHRELCLTETPQPVDVNVNVILNSSMSMFNHTLSVKHSCAEDDVKMKSAFLVGTKGLVQIFINPLVGKLIDTFFPALALLLGIIANMLSTTLYALGKDYTTIMFARAINGVGAASIGSACLALIADTFHKATERNRYIGIVNFFLFAGNAIGPTYGGVFYDLTGQNKMIVFLLYLPIFFLTGLLLIPVWNKPKTTSENCLQVSIVVDDEVLENLDELKPEVTNTDTDNTDTCKKEVHTSPNKEKRLSKINDDDVKVLLPIKNEKSATPFWKLLVDPYILVCATGLIVANLSHNCLAATIGIWMDHRFDVTDSEKGLVWLPTLPFHFVGSALTVWLCAKFPSKRYAFAMGSLVLGGFSCLLMPYMPNKVLTTIPIGLIFFTIAVVDVTLLPMLSHIVDMRHTSVYGSVSAIAYAAFSVASAFGCFASGPIFTHLGFTWLSVILFIVCIFYSPVLLLTKNYCPK